MTDGLTLNNQGVQLLKAHKYQEALVCFKKAVVIKMNGAGVVSVHTCISLSGYADALLGLGQYDQAWKEARRLQQIAQLIKDKNQANIANEILRDIDTRSGVKRDRNTPFEDIAAITVAQYEN